MALPTFVAAGTPAAGTGAIVVGQPAGAQADDILVLGVDSNSSQPAAAPTGYTQFPDSPQDVGGLGSACLSAFWKRHSGSETDPTVADTGNHQNAVIIAIRGCVTTGDPFDVTAGDVTAGGAGSTVVTIPGDTTTVADCLIVALATHSTDTLTAQFSAWANTDLSDVTERVDASTDAGGGGGLGIATGGKATAGAYGNTTATLATSSEQARMSIALKPAAGGATHFGASMLTVSVNVASSGFKKTFGASTQTLAFSFTSAAFKKTFGSSTQTLAFAFGSAGVARKFGASSQTLTFGFASAGHAKTFGASSLPVVLTFDSNGVIVPPGPVTHFGSSTLPFAVNIASAGLRTTFGSSSQTFAFAFASAAFKTTFGSSTLPLVFGGTSSARIKALASSSLSIVFTFTSNGEVPSAVPDNVPGTATVTDALLQTASSDGESEDEATASTGDLYSATVA